MDIIAQEREAEQRARSAADERYAGADAPRPAPAGQWTRQVNATLVDLHRRLDATQRRVDELEARLEAVDASFIRHQGQNEAELDRLQQGVDRVAQDLDRHSDAHWRSGR